MTLLQKCIVRNENAKKTLWTCLDVKFQLHSTTTTTNLELLEKKTRSIERRLMTSRLSSYHFSGQSYAMGRHTFPTRLEEYGTKTNVNTELREGE